MSETDNRKLFEYVHNELSEKEKKESKETLKSRYFRCEEKLREIVFPSKEQIA